MESKKTPNLQRFLIDAPPPYSSAQVLERFLEDAKKWPKKMLADSHVRRVLADTRRNLEWARKNPMTDAQGSPVREARESAEREKRQKDFFEKKSR
jgi:hypothetical protein